MAYKYNFFPTFFFKINKLNKNFFLWQIVKKSFYLNFVSYRLLFNLYYFFLFEKFSINKNFKNIFYLMENQSWERSFLYHFQNDVSKKYGFIHSSLRFWDSRYFYLKKFNLYKKYLNKKIMILNSEYIKKIFLNKFKIPKKNIMVLSYLKKKIKFSPDIKANPNYFLIYADYKQESNILVKELINYLNLLNNKNMIFLKLHPLSDKFFFKNIKNTCIVDKVDNLNLYKMIFVTNTTTVGLDLYVSGCKNLFTLVDKNFLNFSPLKGYFSYNNYLYSINNLNIKYINSENTFKKKNFYKIVNKNFDWIKLFDD